MKKLFLSGIFSLSLVFFAMAQPPVSIETLAAARVSDTINGAMSTKAATTTHAPAAKQG
ncbi:MAG: hypothetical protein JST39_22305, partial [Bacteroidetes bacterium]|nr:hypothetical protein [Bacteroidota bacterium]